MPNPVVHFEIVGKDQQLLESFYKSIFDWQITPAMEAIRWPTRALASAAASAAGARLASMSRFMSGLKTWPPRWH
jgi:predicted enzyme related to lactoylglutathione lyase